MKRSIAHDLQHYFLPLFLRLQCRVSYLPKSHLLGQPETSTEHPFLWRHVPHIIYIDILHIRCDLCTQMPTNLLADALDLLYIVVALCREAVHVDHRQFLGSVRCEEFLDFRGREPGDVGVETDEGGEEGDGGSGQVHDVV